MTDSLTIMVLILFDDSTEKLNYRRDILKGLNSNLYQELQYVDDVIAENPKNYQVWHHRRVIVEWLNDASDELRLTESVLNMDQKNYHAWQHRQWAMKTYKRDILKGLNSNLYQELQYVDDVIAENPKNYQVWHHRRVIVEWLNDASDELRLTESVLNMDQKNYHAWQHRQWAMKTYNLYDDELDYVDRLISDDVRNNSAWNQRFFVLKHFGFTHEVINREINYAMNRIRFVKNNESVWNFLVGVLHDGGAFSDQYEEVRAFCEDLFANGVRSPYLIAFLIDLYQDKCLQEENAQNAELLSNKVIELCEGMIRDHDTIRKKYWQYVIDSFKLKLKK